MKLSSLLFLLIMGISYVTAIVCDMCYLRMHIEVFQVAYYVLLVLGHLAGIACLIVYYLERKKK